MPFYEYECPHCGHHEEVLQSIGEKPLKKCSSCGKNGLKKLISAPVFRLKGSGWYETDFKSDKENKRNLVGSEKEESKAEEKKPDAKADAKPEAAKPQSDKHEKSEKSESAKPVAAKTGVSSSAKRSRPTRTAKRLPARPVKRPTRR